MSKTCSIKSSVCKDAPKAQRKATRKAYEANAEAAQLARETSVLAKQREQQECQECTRIERAARVQAEKEETEKKFEEQRKLRLKIYEQVQSLAKEEEQRNSKRLALRKRRQDEWAIRLQNRDPSRCIPKPSYQCMRSAKCSDKTSKTSLCECSKEESKKQWSAKSKSTSPPGNQSISPVAPSKTTPPGSKPSSPPKSKTTSPPGSLAKSPVAPSKTSPPGSKLSSPPKSNSNSPQDSKSNSPPKSTSPKESKMKATGSKLKFFKRSKENTKARKPRAEDDNATDDDNRDIQGKSIVTRKGKQLKPLHWPKFKDRNKDYD